MTGLEQKEEGGDCQRHSAEALHFSCC